MTPALWTRIALIALAGFAVSADPAAAYIGPGLGAGAIGMILGVLASIGLAIFAIFWYPIKRLLKGKKKTTAVESKSAETKPDA